MKRILSLLIVAVALVIAGCTTRSTVPNKTTAGKSYDMFILASDDLWQGDLRFAVCDALEADAVGLTRPEGYFNIVDWRNPDKATVVDLKYGNILKLAVEPWRRMYMPARRPSLRQKLLRQRLYRRSSPIMPPPSAKSSRRQSAHAATPIIAVALPSC